MSTAERMKSNTNYGTGNRLQTAKAIHSTSSLPCLANLKDHLHWPEQISFVCYQVDCIHLESGEYVKKLIEDVTLRRLE